jgi:hypothetical protein
MTKAKNTDRVLYEKVNGRYKPVRFGLEYDYFPEGYHLIHVDSTGQSWLLNVDPTKVRLKAFVRENLHQRVLEAVKRASQLQSGKETKLTPKQLKAYEAYKEALGDIAHYVHYPSKQEIADMICNEMEKWVHEYEKRSKRVSDR